MRTSSAVPKEVVVVYNQALDLSNRGEFIPALNEYRKAIKMYPAFIEAYNNIGEIYSKMGNTEGAISTYKQALEINRNYRVLLNLGVEYYNQGDYDTALLHFYESVSQKADFLEGHFYAGMANFNRKEYKKAEMHFSEVTKLDVAHAKANYLLSYIYYEWKDYNRALVCLDRIKNSTEDRAFVNRYYGFCLYHLGKYNESIQYLSIALESSEKYAQFKDYLKSLTYENKMREIGDLDARIGEMETQMTETKPSLSEFTRLSMLYIFKGEYQKAEKLLLDARGNGIQ